MFNSIQVTNYWFTLHCALRLLYQQAQTFSPNIWGISDQNMHKKLTDALYIYDLFKNLHEYLQHCLQCQLNQTPCHKPYGVLQSIFALLCSFHTLTIDFILALSVIKASETYETIMSVTDKFSKTVTLISERDTMTVKDWAICLLNHLALLNWELSKAIISD